MKPLKEHILEGILDVENNINIDTSDMTKDVIEEFLKDNYNIKGAHTIKKTKNGFAVDVKGKVEVKNRDITSLTNEFFAFGVVSRDFDCASCKSLKTLEGAPKKVRGNFYCFRCESLKTLEGAPQKVGGEFVCCYCNSLISLKGAPQKVSNDFTCGGCTSLISLKGAPKEIDEDFYCSGCKSLKSLEGAPESCRGFYCNNCGVKFTEDDVRKYTNVIGKINI